MSFLAKFLSAMGGVPGPFSCYLALRGVKTLHLRMREHEKNAFEVVKFLKSSPNVLKVIYPGKRSVKLINYIHLCNPYKMNLN